MGGMQKSSGHGTPVLIIVVLTGADIVLDYFVHFESNSYDDKTLLSKALVYYVSIVMKYSFLYNY